MDELRVIHRSSGSSSPSFHPSIVFSAARRRIDRTLRQGAASASTAFLKLRRRDEKAFSVATRFSSAVPSNCSMLWKPGTEETA